MNWSRIWIGAAIAAVVLWFFDTANIALSQRVLVTEPNLTWGEIASISASLILPSLVMGFLLSWLYVLARPRLGPGPKTALIMGSIGFAFATPQFFSTTVWVSSFEGALIMIVVTWLKFAMSTYLAGWQYIEKAP